MKWPGWAVALHCAVAAAAPSTSLLESARRDVRLAFERKGRAVPEMDPALEAAAQSLAVRSLAAPSSRLGDPLQVARAVSEAGGFDPSPRALFLRASPAEEVLRALEARTDLAAEPATHAGLGWAESGERSALVVLLSERKALLRAFPHSMSAPTRHRQLCGALRSPLRQPTVFVTRPQGSVEKLPARRGAEEDFCEDLSFPSQGLHTVEVLGTGPQGPEVAALFFVSVGTSPAPADVLQAEPATPAEASANILAHINALRAAEGAGPVSLDPALQKVAQAYSDRMAREHFFAHVAPDGLKLADRLHAAHYPFRTAGENLGLASGPLAAHFGIEHSPGHRKNLLEPVFSRLGLGMSVEHVEGRDQVVLTEVLASAATAAAGADPRAEAYRTYDALRAAHHLPPLRRSAALEALAMEHARRALAMDEPKGELPGASLHERIFASVPSAKRASVDLFIAPDPGALPDTKNLQDRANNLVGIGIARGDSPRFGRDRCWVVVLLAGTGDTP